MADPEANVGDIDQATRTLYASDPFSNTVSCDQHRGLQRHAYVRVRPSRADDHRRSRPRSPGAGLGYPDRLRALGTAANKVAVVNAATCNAQDSSGCGQTPGVVKVGKGTFVLAVSAATDTIYAPSTGAPAFNGHTVAVINGAACNATDHSGCGHLAATVKVGRVPLGVAVNDRTHTVYVANNTLGETPGRGLGHQRRDLQRLRHLGLCGPHAHRPGRPVAQQHRGGPPHRHHVHHRREQRRRLGAAWREVPRRDDTRLPRRRDPSKRSVPFPSASARTQEPTAST